MTTEHTPRRFEDTEGRSWLLDLNVATIEAVRKETGCDLLNDIQKTYEELSSNLRLFVDVLYVVVKPQCDDKGISDEEFGRGLSGDVLDHASQILLEAIIDFFPKHQRAATRMMLAKLEETALRAEKTMIDKISDPKVEAAIDRELERSGDSFLKSLESLGSTPDPARSEN